MAEVGDVYPGSQERITGKVKNPNGPGFWLVGEHGGVFAEGGAPFLGSYFTLEERHRNAPRYFTGIETTPGGGYRLLTDRPGEAGYAFEPDTPPPAPAPPAPAAPAPAPTGIPTEADGKAIFTESLRQQGFTPQSAAALADKLWNPSKTRSEDELWVDLRKTDEYNARFGVLNRMRQRAAGGEFISHIPSESEYLELESGYAGRMRDAGLPPSFYDSPDDFGRFVENDVSVAELDERIDTGLRAAISLPPAARAALGEEYLGTGDIAAFFLDPTKADDVLNRQRGLLDIGAAGINAGYRLSRTEAERVQNFGVTGAQAGQGLTELALQAPLFANTAEETGEITREEQIGAQFGGSAEAQSEIARRRAARQARFGGGGGAAGIGGRGSGLGTAE